MAPVPALSWLCAEACSVHSYCFLSPDSVAVYRTGEIEALIKSYSDRGIKAGKAPKDLWTDIGGDTSFKYEEFMKCMVDRSAYLAYCCWDAIAGTGGERTLKLQPRIPFFVCFWLMTIVVIV